MFSDRREAGDHLAERIKELALPHPVVLGVPRGGVVVAARVAAALAAPLDVVVPRKIRAPRNPELAIGAVGPGGEVVIDAQAVALVGADPDYIAEESRCQGEEVRRRLALYRGKRPPIPLAGKDLIVVDDGAATGSTLQVALRALRPSQPASLTVAIPVAPPETVARLEQEATRVVCLLAPSHFYAVGQFYSEFEQVSDGEVVALLQAYTTPSSDQQ